MSALVETPSDMHRIARHVRAHADDIRARANRLSATAAQTHWYSPAAVRFRAEVAALVRHMHTAAGRLDDAAHTLDRHAARVSSVASAPVHAAESVVSWVVHL
jgi:uncharacterized protein YukE